MQKKGLPGWGVNTSGGRGGGGEVRLSGGEVVEMMESGFGGERRRWRRGPASEIGAGGGGSQVSVSDQNPGLRSSEGRKDKTTIQRSSW